MPVVLKTIRCGSIRITDEVVSRIAPGTLAARPCDLLHGRYALLRKGKKNYRAGADNLINAVERAKQDKLRVMQPIITELVRYAPTNGLLVPIR